MKALILFGVICAGGAAISEAAPSLDRFREAADAHPDDAELAWALAAELAEAGALDEARQRFVTIRERWPERTARASLELGRIDHDSGACARALPELERAIETDPFLGEARLYRALCLSAQGQAEAAARELAVLSLLSSELRGEALLLQGLGRWRAGERREAEQLLRASIAHDPQGPIADRARQTLGRIGLESPRVSGWLRVGGALDSNVTLDSDTFDVGDASDAYSLWSGGVTFQPWRFERGGLSLAYAASHRAHEELEAFDLFSHTALASVALDLAPDARIQLDAGAFEEHLAHSRYRRSWLARPALEWTAARGRRRTRLYAEVRRERYPEPPAFESLQRGGTSYAAGAAQSFELSRWPGGALALSLRASRTHTRAQTDALGFEGDFDRRSYSGELQLALPLRHNVDLRAQGRISYEPYRHVSLIDATTHGGTGTARPARRRSTIGSVSVVLGWRFRPGSRLDLAWTGYRERSNVDVYDLERHVLSLSMTWNWRLP